MDLVEELDLRILAPDLEKAAVDLLPGHGLRAVSDGLTPSAGVVAAAEKHPAAAEQGRERSMRLDFIDRVVMPRFDCGELPEVAGLKFLDDLRGDVSVFRHCPRRSVVVGVSRDENFSISPNKEPTSFNGGAVNGQIDYISFVVPHGCATCPLSFVLLKPIYYRAKA